MPDEFDRLPRLITTLEGQVRALREHVTDADRSCAEVSHLVVTIEGAWCRIRSTVLKGYVSELVDAASARARNDAMDLDPPGPDHREQQLLAAVERIAGR